MYQKTKQLFTFLFTLIVLFSCSNDSKPVIIEGTVTNIITALPVSGINIKVNKNRCGLTGLKGCGPIKELTTTDQYGKFNLSFNQECTNEFEVQLISGTKDSFPLVDIIITEHFDKDITLSCHDNVLIDPDQNYNFDILIQPQIILTLNPVESESLDLDKILIGEFEIEIQNLILGGVSKTLNITQYTGDLEIELIYKNSSPQKKYVPYDYFASQNIKLDVAT